MSFHCHGRVLFCFVQNQINLLSHYFYSDSSSLTPTQATPGSLMSLPYTRHATCLCDMAHFHPFKSLHRCYPLARLSLSLPPNMGNPWGPFLFFCLSLSAAWCIFYLFYLLISRLSSALLPSILPEPREAFGQSTFCLSHSLLTDCMNERTDGDLAVHWEPVSEFDPFPLISDNVVWLFFFLLIRIKGQTLWWT